MPLLNLKYFPIVETAIALLVIWLPLSNSTVLINGIQTAKSFNFFYGMLALAGMASIGLLFRRNKLQLNVTHIYTALGDSQKALKENSNAEKNYWQASEMAPGKFYPQYLLAKLYDESMQQQKAVEMANLLLLKDIKIESKAIEEIKEEMQNIIDKYGSVITELTIHSVINNGQKERYNKKITKIMDSYPAKNPFN